MKKCVILTLVSLSFLIGIAYAGTFKNEPDGFRGISWGTNIKSLDNMKYKAEGPTPGLKIYERTGDSVKVGAAKLEYVRYSFFQGRFASAEMSVKFSPNWEALKGALFMNFGKVGDQANPSTDGDYMERFYWLGDQTVITAQFSFTRLEGFVTFQSKNISAEIEAYHKEKLKEAGDTGF